MGIRTTLWRILYGLLLENKPPKLKKSPFDEKFTLELLPDLMDVDHVEFPIGHFFSSFCSSWYGYA